jgi:hypothetical protein
MKTDRYTRVILTVIAALLAYNSFFTRPAAVQAQGQGRAYTIERVQKLTPAGSAMKNTGQIVGTCETENCYIITVR